MGCGGSASLQCAEEREGGWGGEGNAWVIIGSRGNGRPGTRREGGKAGRRVFIFLPLKTVREPQRGRNARGSSRHKKGKNVKFETKGKRKTKREGIHAQLPRPAQTTNQKSQSQTSQSFHFPFLSMPDIQEGGVQKRVQSFPAPKSRHGRQARWERGQGGG